MFTLNATLHLLINQEISYRFITFFIDRNGNEKKRKKEKLPNFTKDKKKGANLITAFQILRFLANISSLKNHLSRSSLYTRRWRLFASPDLQTKTLQYWIPKEPGPTSLKKKTPRNKKTSTRKNWKISRYYLHYFDKWCSVLKAVLTCMHKLSRFHLFRRWNFHPIWRNIGCFSYIFCTVTRDEILCSLCFSGAASLVFCLLKD